MLRGGPACISPPALLEEYENFPRAWGNALVRAPGSDSGLLLIGRDQGASSPGCELLGPHHRARPGEGAHWQEPGGQDFTHGARLNPNNIGLPSCVRRAVRVGCSVLKAWALVCGPQASDIGSYLIVHMQMVFKMP